jgi:hypothetical protein
MVVDIILFYLYRFVITVVFPILGVVILGRIAWKFWLHYIQQDFISGIEYTLLEIVPPREVLRSPRAMELFFTNALYHWSEKGGKEEYWQGAVWFWFSLEIVSLGGQVHFYIRTPSRIKGLIETQMYAQYPQAQVKVVEDYTLGVDEISEHSKWMGWGCEFKLHKNEVFPIKTYVDYGLEDDPKEEYKVDPISSVIEFFGSLTKDEQAWIQIVVTPLKRQFKTKGTRFGKHDWIAEAKLVVTEALRPYVRQNKRLDMPEGQGYTLEYRTPDFLKNAIDGVNAKTSKLAFDTGIRVMYIAKKEAYDMSNRRNIRLMFRQYAKPDCNEFWRINSAQADRYSGLFPASQKTIMMLANRMLEEYRERMFFHPPMRHHLFSQHNWDWPLPGIWTLSGIIKAYVHHETFILNTEELATLWHFPGQILKVPTLTRIESKEASPPPNLPV